jgi:effector-binding domain-containing protein
LHADDFWRDYDAYRSASRVHSGPSDRFSVIVRNIGLRVTRADKANQTVGITQLSGPDITNIGSYTETGSLIPVLQREMIAQELEPTGPPFALYYDDPGTTPVERLRSRACIPIGGERSPRQPLQYEVLPSTTVVYALVAGPYPEVPRSYPGLYAFLERQGWIENGPIREIYLPPTSVRLEER